MISFLSQFILKKPNQTQKALRSNSIAKLTTLKIIYGETENQENTHALQKVLNELLSSMPDIEKKEIL